MIGEDKQKLLLRASTAKRESKHLDFKEEFDLSSNGAWCETIKDVVAFANSGGGVIVFGVRDDGQSSSINPQPILSYDHANIVNCIAKYTGYQFDSIEVLEVMREGILHAGFLVLSTEVPIVFTKPGTYDIGNNKQKTAFGTGTIYFRHGAKSEPGNRSDLVTWRDKEVARVRGEWLGGIRKVVRAPKGHAVAIVPVNQIKQDTSGNPAIVRISNSPNAATFIPRNAEEIWPHRQKSLLVKVNQKLSGITINGHDILCVNHKIDVLKSCPEFAYKPHKMASPQYSDQYAEWLVEQGLKDPNFFRSARELYNQSQKEKM